MDLTVFEYTPQKSHETATDWNLQKSLQGKMCFLFSRSSKYQGVLLISFNAFLMQFLRLFSKSCDILLICNYVPLLFDGQGKKTLFEQLSQEFF